MLQFAKPYSIPYAKSTLNPAKIYVALLRLLWRATRTKPEDRRLRDTQRSPFGLTGVGALALVLCHSDNLH